MPWKDKQKHNADNLSRYHRGGEAEKAKRRERSLSKQTEAAGRPPGDHCDICKVLTVRPHFDHNHATGEFRGWLCGPCNKGLGLFQDLPDNLLAAAEYLRKRGFAAG